jgi:hypothetical protein
MIRRRVWIPVAVIVFAAVALAVRLSVTHPSNDRHWAPEHAVMPHADFRGDSVLIHNVRNFVYASGTNFTPKYEERAYDLSTLESVWFIVTPFSRSWRGPAHTFVSFGFADSQFVGISVEARREPGENYAVLTGLLERFELIYVIGSESDLIGSRTAFAEFDVYLYPIRASPDKMRQLFIEMLQRANGLRTQPEFYHTVTNNCTSNVVAHVNSVAPGKVPHGLKTILPGYSDEVAYSLGLIDTTITLDESRRRFRVNDRAKQFAGRPDFSLRIRDIASAGSSSTP